MPTKLQTEAKKAFTPHSPYTWNGILWWLLFTSLVIHLFFWEQYQPKTTTVIIEKQPITHNTATQIPENTESDTQANIQRTIKDPWQEAKKELIVPQEVPSLDSVIYRNEKPAPSTTKNTTDCESITSKNKTQLLTKEELDQKLTCLKAMKQKEN